MKRITVVFLVLMLCISLSACQSENAYREAIALQEAGQYDAALAAFSRLGDYKDSKYRITELLQEQAYAQALALLDGGNYAEAFEAFNALGDYKDTAEYLARFKEIKITQENWKEYLHTEETATPLKNALGEYEMIQFSYYMKFNDDIAQRFYAPLEFISYTAGAFCNEQILEIDPKTGKYTVMLSEYFVENTHNWNVFGITVEDNVFHLADAVRYSIGYDENGESTDIYALLTGFYFQELEINIYLYQ